jgi:hypothetical protein
MPGVTRARKHAGLVLVFSAILAAAAIAGWLDRSRPGDVLHFALWGSTLVSHNALHTFHDPQLQAAPLELVLAWFANTVGGGPAGFAIVLDVVSMAAVAAGAFVLLGRRAAGLAVFGAVSVVLLIPGEAYRGHPAEPLIGVLWLLAAREARRGRAALAGAYIGLSACFELWGVLGVTALALAPDVRRCARGLLPAVALPAVSLLPFVLAGDFRMLHFHWLVHQGAPLLLLGSGHAFTWPFRLVEAAVVTLGGASVALALRRRPEAIFLVPAATVILRIALDPIANFYYWDTLRLIAAIGVAQLVLQRVAIADRLPAGLERVLP